MRHAVWPARCARGERRAEWVNLIRSGILPCLLALAAAAALASSPQVALAAEGSYSIDRVDIDATIADDGSAEITERRTFSFDGSFHGVYWKVPLGEGTPTEIESAGIVNTDGGTQEFTQSEDGGEGTYSVSEEDDCWMVNRPPLLVCDEPTGNLDPAISLGIMKLLDRINRTGTTVVMATHDREMVDSMRKRVIALEAGHVVRDQERGGYSYYGAL